MKRKIPILGAFLIALLMAVVGVTLSSCHGDKPVLPFGSTETVENNDSVLFAQYISRAIDPDFTSTAEILQFRKCKSENARVDSVFMSMDDETIKNVASVCLKRSPSVKRRDLILEYTKNIDIYAALPRNIEIQDKKNPTPTTEESRVTRVEVPAENTLSISLRDTIIEGKKYRIETKLVEYNE